MIKLEIQYGSLKGVARVPRVNFERCLKAAERVLRLSGKRSVSLAFVNAHAMKRLNEAYHGGHGVTDVLAFPSDAISGRDGYMGEILLYYPRARMQAASRGATVKDEVLLLFVHGVLHLLGFDHDTPSHKARMFRLQERILHT
ncbi:rRNA maturation RNase YbeY [Candidatus Uhrbacteria bacterium]|nr:rRNA maturation RNase YbeY [Candidatus Uhrbacteria bacterium]